MPITVRDISSTGVKVSSDMSFFVGTRVEVELPNIGWASGEVVRMDGQGTTGIRFDAIVQVEQAQVRITGTYGAPPVVATPQLRRV
jgi:hypothetical protein